MDHARFTRDKAAIRAELELRARARRTITYGESAVLVGRTARGLGGILDAVEAEEERKAAPTLAASW